MASQGQFPKSEGDVFYGSDVNDMNTASLANLSKTTIQSLFSAQITSWNSGVQNGSPFIDNAFIVPYGQNTVSNFAGVGNKYMFFAESGVAHSIDEFNLSPGLNGSVWTLGGSTSPTIVSGTDGYVLIQRTSNGNSWLKGVEDIGSAYKGAMTFYLKNAAGNGTCGLYILGLGNQQTAQLYNIYDGVTDTTMYTCMSGTYIYTRKSTEINWTAVNTSGLTGSRVLYFVGTYNGTQPNLQISWIRRMPDYAISGVIISNGIQVSEPLTTAIMHVNGFRNSNVGSTFYISPNSGVNWESITPSTLHRFSNTGSYLKTMIVATGSSDGVLNMSIDNQGVYYNLI